MSRQFMKVNRKLDFGHQAFMANCAKANVGTSQGVRILKEFVSGYENVGATSVDFQNSKRDFHAYIDGCDAQYSLDKLSRKNDKCAAFYYKHDIDENDQLRCVFWADPVARRNHTVLGDIASFDVTYSTNRYARDVGSYLSSMRGGCIFLGVVSASRGNANALGVGLE
ncbi:PREDICTED: protein FAR1-RELATED SEQUENCE 5-like [Ipomoea nil]|uniref:protein FAR1-RELATED SEQUENCE 5-like n=1 Tax=Ipomoea nil TaxID=35883 RepID=UPI000901C68B|nr:PREDICTED: protein FAR1-RELATED SEQUENCE 5-like [Ipomoea nil]